jgi:hypothetical protein
MLREVCCVKNADVKNADVKNADAKNAACQSAQGAVAPQSFSGTLIVFKNVDLAASQLNERMWVCLCVVVSLCVCGMW